VLRNGLREASSVLGYYATISEPFVEDPIKRGSVRKVVGTLYSYYLMQECIGSEESRLGSRVGMVFDASFSVCRDKDFSHSAFGVEWHCPRFVIGSKVRPL